MAYVSRLKKEYKERVIEALKEEFNYTNVMESLKPPKVTLTDSSRPRRQKEKALLDVAEF